MAQIVNLRQVRRKKEKAKREAKAEQNRMLFGRTKAERQRDEAVAENASKRLNGHRLDGKQDE